MGRFAVIIVKMPTELWEAQIDQSFEPALRSPRRKSFQPVELYLPRKGGDDCLVELRWLYDRRDAAEARRDLAAWLLRWRGHRGNLHLLSAAPRASRASEEHQYA